MATTTAPAGTDPALNTQDPFAAQRTTENNPFGGNTEAGPTATTETGTEGVEDTNGELESPDNGERRGSREWDAAKVPPSQFQKRKGSIYAVPGSRETHHNDKSRDAKYHEKLKEKGWGIFGSKK